MMNKIKTHLKDNTLEHMEMDRQNRIFKFGAVKLAVILCVLFDTWVFYTRFDSILNNKMIVSLLMAVACAAAIDFFPVVVTNRLMTVKKTKTDYAMIVLFGCLFGAVVVLSVMLGILGAKDLAGSSSGMMTMMGMGSAPAQAEVTLPQQVVSVLLGFMPVITSAIIIGMSFVDAKTNRINTLKLQELQLEKALGELRAQLTYLEEGMAAEDLEGLDNERFAIMTGILEDIRLYCWIVSRRVLTTKLGDSTAMVHLMQENTLRESIDAKIKGDLSMSEPETIDNVRMVTEEPIKDIEQLA